VLLALLVAASVVVPAAIAWACGPNRQMQMDRFVYEPGQTVTVRGSNFQAGAELRFTLEPGSNEVARVTVPTDTSFEVAFPAPSTPGSYVVQAQGYQNGERIDWLVSRESFEVRQPQSTTPPSTETPTPGATAPAPGTTAPAPGATAPSGPGTSPRTQRGAERPAARSGEGRRVGSRAGGGAVRPGDVTMIRQGRRVFAGSVPRQQRVAAAGLSPAPGRRPAAGFASRGERSSQRSAVGDVWSGFGTSRNPSLVPKDGDPAVADGGSSSGVAWGIGLLSLGLLTLVGAVGVAEARRRRALSG
jgi:hypothetical protein